MVFLFDKSIQEWETRLEELRQQIKPLEEEARQLERALAAVKEEGRANTGRQRMPLAERKQMIVELVKSRPGIRIGEIAGEMGVSEVRVVQVVNELEATGDVSRRKGGGIDLGH